MIRETHRHPGADVGVGHRGNGDWSPGVRRGTHGWRGITILGMVWRQRLIVVIVVKVLLWEDGIKFISFQYDRRVSFSNPRAPVLQETCIQAFSR